MINTLLSLFWSFFQIGAFSVGGGYAALAFIRDQVIAMNGWLNMTEFGDIVTISQMTPGPIALNAATFVGIRVAGIWGGIVATLGCVIPCMLIALFLAFAYYRFRKGALVRNVMDFLRPASIGLIGTAGLTVTAMALWNGSLSDFSFASVDITAVLIFAAALFVILKFRLSPIPVILGSGAVGLIIHFIFQI